MFDYETLRFIWWMLVGALLMGFAITDGMDMGVGSLLPFVARTDTERRIAINTIGPHWDGNQVWFITAGGALFAAWPAVYAAAFSGFYMAMLLVLFALFFRPVGFDYRSKIENPTWRNIWDWGLFAGGAIPALIFGVAFGNLLQGVPFYLDDLLRSHYQGSLLTALLPLLNPFALLAGVISLTMLVVHGAVWLQLRTADPVAARARGIAMGLAPLVTIAFAAAGVWLWFGVDGYRIVSAPPHGAFPNPLAKQVVRDAHAWFDIYRRMPVALIAPALGLCGPLATALLAKAGRPGLAFVTSALGMVGVIGSAGLSMFPFVMPSSIDLKSSLTIWDAASSHLTLTVMFWAVVILLPMVLAYTVWCYARMWGKVTAAEIESRSPLRLLKEETQNVVFHWILGVTAAIAIGVINVMWYEFQDNLDGNGAAAEPERAPVE